MLNNTSATLMLQTIMVLMDKHNATDVGLLNDDHEICYGNYGCFSKAYPWTENRPENYFPASPADIGVKYALFTRKNVGRPVLLDADDAQAVRDANIDPMGPFYFISHGFLEGGHKAWIEEMTKELLRLEGNAAATVVVVDWRGGSQPPYGQAVANIRLVGVMTAHLINHMHKELGLPDVKNFHFIGHSLGAHLGGYCGHALQKRFRLKLGRITGLDPAAPHFTKTVTLVRLDRSDAEYVDIIHSNAIPLYMSGFGISEPIGHVDFYPNGGSYQPGCRRDAAPPGSDMVHNMQKYIGCNHDRSYEYFTESIAPACPFMGIQCESYEAFEAGNCTICNNKHLCIPMGHHSYEMYKRLQQVGYIDTNSNVALYAQTGATKPYCRVHYEVRLQVSNSSESRKHGPDVGRVAVVLVDRHANRSDYQPLDNDQRYYKPGELATKMVAFKDTGFPPVSVIVEWKYESNLFNPMTWRLLKSSSLYIESLKLTSIEYNTDITVCPKMNKPVVANMPTIMKPKYCRFR